MDDFIGLLLYTTVAGIAGALLQFSGFLPWLLNKLPWRR